MKFLTREVAEEKLEELTGETQGAFRLWTDNEIFDELIALDTNS